MINKNKIEYLLFNSIVKLVTIGKIENARKPAKVLARLLYYVIPLRKKTLIKNFSIAFPEKNKEELKQLIFKNYLSSAITFCEIAHLSKAPKEDIDKLITCKRTSEIQKILDSGKSVLLLTAHFGNWELGAFYFGLNLNKITHVLAKPQRNPFVTKWLTDMRKSVGNAEIPLGISVRGLLKAVRDGYPIGVVGDQRGPRKNGVRVDFFNRPTATFTGTAAIALKTKTPIFTVMIVRNNDYKYEAIIEEIPIDNLVGSEEEKIKHINQKYMSILENHIRKNPEQWFWMHNIWKH